jgi:hypothetical protein
MNPDYTVHWGRLYRLKLRNAGDYIPLHPHRRSFELAWAGGKLLFHCHQQLRMDFGLMAMFRYA